MFFHNAISGSVIDFTWNCSITENGLLCSRMPIEYLGRKQFNGILIIVLETYNASKGFIFLVIIHCLSLTGLLMIPKTISMQWVVKDFNDFFYHGWLCEMQNIPYKQNKNKLSFTNLTAVNWKLNNLEYLYFRTQYTWTLFNPSL